MPMRREVRAGGFFGAGRLRGSRSLRWRTGICEFMATSRLAVNVFTMSHKQDEHDYAFILNITDNAIVTDPIAPQAFLVPTKWLTKLPRIGSRLNVFSQELK